MKFEKQISEVNEVTSEAHITIPVDEAEVAYQVEIQKLVARAKIKGFRPGKAPRQMVEGIYGQQTRNEVAYQLISSSVRELSGEFERQVIGMPDLEMISMEHSKPIEFKAKYYFYPQPQIKKYDSIKIKVRKSQNPEESLAKALQNIRGSKAKVEDLTGRDVLEKGDIIKAQIQDAEPGAEYSPLEPIHLPTGEGYLPEKLEEGLYGMKVGEEREVTVQFPKDHPNQGLREKKIQYKVKLEGLALRTLPELNDEFVKELAYQGVTTVAELEAKLKEVVEGDIKKQEEAAINDGILINLSEANPFAIPQIMIDHEIKRIAAQQGLVDMNKVKFEDINPKAFTSPIPEMADQNLRAGIILDRVAEQEKLTATREDLDAHLAKSAEEMQVDLELLKNYYAQEQRMQSLQLELTRKKVLALLKDRTKVEYEK